MIVLIIKMRIVKIEIIISDAYSKDSCVYCLFWSVYCVYLINSND